MKFSFFGLDLINLIIACRFVQAYDLGHDNRDFPQVFFLLPDLDFYAILNFVFDGIHDIVKKPYHEGGET